MGPNIPEAIHHASDKPSFFAQLHRTNTRQGNTTATSGRCIQHFNAGPHFRHADFSQVFQQSADLVRVYQVIARSIEKHIPNLDPVER
jgi:hypothetical protein